MSVKCIHTFNKPMDVYKLICIAVLLFKTNLPSTYSDGFELSPRSVFLNWCSAEPPRFHEPVPRNP